MLNVADLTLKQVGEQRFTSASTCEFRRMHQHPYKGNKLYLYIFLQ